MVILSELTQFHLNKKNMNQLKIMPEFGCYPLWKKDDTEGIFENIPLDTLMISENLRNLIQEWDNRFQGTYNDDYPPDSGFISKEEANQFEKEGIEIWNRLRNELSKSYEVSYYSISKNELFEN